MEDSKKGVIEYQNDHDLLIRVDEKLTGLHTKVDKVVEDHEKRIRALEDEKNRWIGKQSIIGALMGSLFALLIAGIGAWVSLRHP